MDALIPYNVEIPLGRIEGESIEQYHRTGAVSHSKLEVFKRRPSEFYRRFISGEAEPQEESEAQGLGQAAHTLILEGSVAFENRYAVEPDFGDCRKTANKEARDNWRALHDKHKPISATIERQCIAMQQGVNRNFVAKALLAHGKPETTWRMPLGPMLLQARTDWFIDSATEDLSLLIPEVKPGERIICDLKTCATLSVDGFGSFFKWAREAGYYRQDALYREVVSKILGEPVHHCFYIAVEKDEPFECAVFRFDDVARDLGVREVIETLKSLIQCAKADEWPGVIQDAVISLDLPEWHVRKMETLLVNGPAQHLLPA